MESIKDLENLCRNIYIFDNYDDNIVSHPEEVKYMFYEDGVKLSSPIPIPQKKCKYEEELPCSFNTYLKKPFDMKQILSNLSDCNDCAKGILFGGEVHCLND